MAFTFTRGISQEEYDDGDGWKADHFYSEEDRSTIAEEVEDASEISEEISGDNDEESEGECSRGSEDDTISSTGSFVEDNEDEENEVLEAWIPSSAQEKKLKDKSSSRRSEHQQKLLKRRSLKASSSQPKLITSSSKETTSGISSQNSSSITSHEEICEIDFSVGSPKLSSRASVTSKLISPYEAAIIDDSLRSFVTKKRLREKKSGCSSNDSTFRAFSPRKYIAEKIAEAQLQCKKERLNNVDVLQKKVLELSDENRTLNRLVKRQGVVLDRISSHQGELPSLLSAHNEEVRVMRQRMRQAQDISRQLEEKLRFRDAEIYRLKESTKSIINSVGSSRKQSRASSQHHLDLEDLKEMIEEKEHEISELRHRLAVLKKSSRQQLNNEINKYKALQKKLDSALETISQLKITIQEKDKMINHSNIYAHRRFGSRLGKSKLSISSASSMISLAPMDEEDILNYSLKNNDSTKEDDLDFNFDDQDEVHNHDDKIDMKADHPNMIENSPKNKIQDMKSPEKSKENSPKMEEEEEYAKVDQENPFDFKTNEDTKQRNVSSAKDYYDGFYDNNQEKKKLSNNEAVLNVNDIPVTPLPSPRKSSKEDPEQDKKVVPEISSPDKGSLIERQNSFKTTQKFFQENGTIIEPKEYKKAMVDEPDHPNEPLETSRTKKFSPRSQKLLDDSKKRQLLASLNALDAKDQDDDQNNSYEPSFVSKEPLKTRRDDTETQVFTFDVVNNNPFNSASFKSLDSSMNSVKSVTSSVSNTEKKAKLMKELFEQAT